MIKIAFRFWLGGLYVLTSDYWTAKSRGLSPPQSWWFGPSFPKNYAFSVAFRFILFSYDYV